MSFNKNRNSRDDKSGRDSNKPSRSSSSNRRPQSGESSSNRKDKPYGDRKDNSNGERKSYGDRKPFGDRKEGGFGGERKSYGDRKPFGDRKEGGFGVERKSYGDRKPFGDRKEGGFGSERKSYGDRKPFGDRKEGGFGGERRERINDREQPRQYRKREPQGEFSEVKDEQVRLRSRKTKVNTKKEDETIRLNRYIANSGICSRRKADELIAAGVVSVNGVVVSELGAKVNPAIDQIRYNGELLKREKMVYVLLNKPKDFITTTDDPQERKTVMELVDKASKERIYPVGRLDRNTTGLLLVTNDGDLAEKLSHPRNNIVKIYNVELDRNLTQGDFNKIAFGLELEDGFIKPDAVSYVTGGARNEIGIQIHSGKNRIVRRIFESLGYEVVKLDRVIYAGLSKKDLPRGKWRYLSEQEIINLKHLIK